MKNNMGGDMNMHRFTQRVGLVAKVVLVGSSLALLGAACWKGVGTNTNVGVGNGNDVASKNTNVVAGNENAEMNGNVGANDNTNTNSTGEIDTSDWLTYTNEEYGFSFRYPQELEIDVRKEDNLFRIYLTNNSLPFDYDFMAFRFESLDQLTMEDWFRKTVDVNDVLTYVLGTTANGYKTLSPGGARDLDDLGGYAQIFKFVEDEKNNRVFAFFGGQDFGPLDSLEYYQPDLINKIIDSFQFKQ